MPTKVTPLPQSVAGAATSGGAGGAGATGKPGSKPVTKGSAKPKLFDTSRFQNARTRLSDFSSMTRERFRGYLGSVLFTALVSLGLMALGIFFVYFGDEKYIVDVIVLGGLCLVMGLVVFLMGFFFVLRPIYKERQQREEERRRERSAQRRFSDQGNNFRNAAFGEEEGGAPLPRPSTSTSHPPDDTLYDRASLRATPDPRGKLTPPSPPPLVQPLKDRPGTTSTVLTATDSEDVFHSEEDGLKYDNER